MRARVCATVFVIVMGSASLYAQEATVVGSVLDESKGVLPGATVTATEIATGRQYVAVTTERGEYRLPSVAPGRYKIQAELTGFGTSVVPDVELLVGQNATLLFTLKVASLAETVTVSGEAPLVDTQRAQVAGNVDRRQMAELPLQGRNWVELTMMVKGATANDVANGRPGVQVDSRFQLNLDGQQISNGSNGSFGQPGLSREAIAEYQVVTNLFDVTMGRSAGIQVQAISRSGTNTPAGSFYGYFRDSRFNAPDFVANRVLPYSDQQIGGTMGGPIIKDKLQYFVSYEHEAQPNTVVYAPAALSPQTFSLPTENDTHNTLVRLDDQLNSTNHLMIRGMYYHLFIHNSGTSSQYPNNGLDRVRWS